MIGKLLCYLRLHNWRDSIIDGINLFMPCFPKVHIQTCKRCKAVRRLSHTMYGSVQYFYDNVADAQAEKDCRGSRY